MILNRAKDYYENDKERLRKQARCKYRNLSKDENNKKREYGRKRYHNMSEEKRQRLKEYQKNYSDDKNSEFKNQYMFLQCMLWLMLTKQTDRDKT